MLTGYLLFQITFRTLVLELVLGAYFTHGHGWDREKIEFKENLNQASRNVNKELSKTCDQFDNQLFVEDFCCLPGNF